MEVSRRCPPCRDGHLSPTGRATRTDQERELPRTKGAVVLPGRLMASTGLLMKFRFLHESRIGLSSGSLTILKYNPQYIVGGDRIKTCPYPYPAVKWAVRQTTLHPCSGNPKLGKSPDFRDAPSIFSPGLFLS